MTKEKKVELIKSNGYTVATNNQHLYPWNKLGYMPKGMSGAAFGWQWFSERSLLNIIPENVLDDALKVLGLD